MLPKDWNATYHSRIEDFKAQTAADGTVYKADNSSSDVLKYTLVDGSWIPVRPSGTEPKSSSTLRLWGETNEESQTKIANIETKSMLLLNKTL